MNLSLIDPFVLAQDYPDSLTGKLSKNEDSCFSIYRRTEATKGQDMQLLYGSIGKEIILRQAG